MVTARTSALAFTTMLFASGGAMAQPAEDSDDGPWSGTAEVSLLATSGNSDTRTFGLGGEVTYDPGTWKWLGRVSYVESEADDQLRARSQGALFEVSRHISERLDVYGRGGYLRDLFAGIRRRLPRLSGPSAPRHSRQLVDPQYAGCA